MPGHLRGKTLNHYEVHEMIGAGGMGEVYRAHDTKLDRDVALKIVTGIVNPQTEKLDRFEREARLLATLNHPGIAAIHGFEESEGIQFLVLEFVPGEDLARQVRRGRLAIDDALDLASQIAEALEASHASGVIHRDLKPANVKLTPEGKVKVLDFGLAKAFERGDASLTMTTVTSDETEGHMILGTGPYMSPEQARARPIDKRTDVWSFGCVLFEMLAGRPAFLGETLSDCVARVLQSEPDWAALPEDTPAAIRKLLRRCLRKDIERRLRDIGDARIEIIEAREALTPGPSSGDDTGSVAQRKAAPRRAWLAAAPAAIALIAGAFYLGSVVNRPSSAPVRSTGGSVTRFLVADPMPYWQADGANVSLALSPDGRSLVYPSSGPRGQRLYMRHLDRLRGVPLAGTDGARGPFFSPDGDWLGYFWAANVVKVSLHGGTPMPVGPAGLPRGADWGADGSIIYTPVPEAGLQRVAAGGGEAVPLTTPQREKRERSHRWPHILPGGKTVLFTVGLADTVTFDDGRIDALSLADGARKTIVSGGTYPVYTSTGHLLYARKGSLMAVRFDPERLELRGDPVDVVSDLVTYPHSGSAHFAVARSGTLAYLSGRPRTLRRTIVWIDQQGNVEPFADRPRSHNTIVLSADGRRLATDVDGACAQIWIHDIERGGHPTRLTREWSNTRPIWTPDGRKVTFASDREGLGDIYWMPTDGSGEIERLTGNDQKQWPGSWSPDGKFLAFVQQDPSQQTDIWILELDGLRATPLIATPYSESVPRFSPDGRWLAYMSNDSITTEIYVKPFPDYGRRWKVSTEGGQNPRWSPDGSKLYFMSRSKVYAVNIEDGPSFGVPEVLFETERIVPEFEVAPDGRFLALRSEDEPAELPIRIVVNWFEELERLVP